MKGINIKEKFEQVQQYWQPGKLAELNEQQVLIAKLKGDFIWHSHANEDELFLVIKGTLFMDFRDRTEKIKVGEIIVVPKGVEHKPRTENNQEVHVLLMEPLGIKHTGKIESERAVKKYNWV